MNKRYTIAVLIDWISSPYHIELMAGLEEAGKKKNVNIITFIGGSLRSPKKYQAMSNYIYDLITQDYIDGIIVESGILGAHSSKEDLIQFLSKFRPIPVVSISAVLDDYPSIVIENSGGLENIIQHLIKDHDYKNIAFISGPPENADSQERLRAYKQILESNNLRINPDMIVAGTFVKTSGKQAICTLLDERGLAPDAIVCANDDMALGAMEELAERKIRIPGDIAVTGFDDQEGSGQSKPPLTTVSLPLQKLSENAVNSIIRCLQNDEGEKKVAIPTEPVIRESCGCTPDSGGLRTEHKGEGYPMNTSKSNRAPVQSLSLQDLLPGMPVTDIFRGFGYMRDSNGMTDFLRFSLPGMGIEDCFYAAFTNNDIANAELLLSYSHNRECRIMEKEEAQPVRDLVKSKICEKEGPFSYRLLSLVYDDTILGILGYQYPTERTMPESTFRTTFLINIMTSLSLRHVLHR